ncbi:MAG TPA: galactose-1-phosphate uridylyltransferase [Acidimicrobiales bacterium]|nr:galactose-1-phosphate uridylyltransferase [Acidimicrobiales bacterium]
MSQLRLDPLTGRWVVVSVDRAQRPAAFTARALPVEAEPKRPCPFCPGNEEATPPALETYGPTGQWRVRVVPNLYPAFEGDEPMVVTHLGPAFTEAPASGIHEVLVLSPEHEVGWGRIDDDQAALVMAGIRDRMDTHSRARTLRYSQAIVNSGREAGASIEHPHGQLMGMPFVPRELVDEQAGFARFSGSCLLCTTVDAEEDAGLRLVYSDAHVVVVCPFWSGSPFEMLVLPRAHDTHLYRATDEVLAAVGRSIRIALERLTARLGDVAYNLVFHSAPYRVAGNYHWHAHLLPKLVTQAGFELGTGVPINVVAPELAAAELRSMVSAA